MEPPTEPERPAGCPPRGRGQTGAVRAGIASVLAQARCGLPRVAAADVPAAVAAGALLVDTRTEAQRAEAGELPGAIVIDRTVLEWRLDPASPDRIPEADGYDRQVIVVCRRATARASPPPACARSGSPAPPTWWDGVEGWVAAGLPLVAGPADVRR